MANATLDRPQEAAKDTSQNAATDTAPANAVPSQNAPKDQSPWLRDLGLTTANPHVFRTAWGTEVDKYRERTKQWMDSYGGRMAIRTVSRGVVGAVFYAIAQTFAVKELKGYKSDEKPANIMQHVARIVDKTAGKGIFNAVKLLNHGDVGKAERAVTFRNTNDYGNAKLGRSLGHEAVAVTFDFAAMSFSDYMTRWVIGLMDPNAHVKWMKDGHIDVPGALKDLFKNVFKGITYAAGEDMAVALPYVYYMKAQRHFINKASPGFKFDFDRGMNGGGYKINDKGEITGNYQLEGMLDLMGRFSAYNVGTKMFRDAYSVASKNLDDWNKHGRKLELPSIDPALTPAKAAKGALHAIGDSARYLVRTTAKVMMYMLPSTFFFYITRAPQGQVRGAPIHSEYGVLGRNVVDGAQSGTHSPHLGEEGEFKSWKPGSRFWNKAPEDLHFQHHPDKKISGVPFTNRREDAFSNAYYAEGKAPWYSRVTHPVGKFCYNAGTVATKYTLPIAKWVRSGFRGTPEEIEVPFDHNGPVTRNKFDLNTEKFVRSAVNASISYTPYFMMKTDFLSAAWDNKRMDMAFDRMLNGMGRLNIKEAGAGFNEIVRTALKEPFSDPKREAAAKYLMRHHTEKTSNEAFQTADIYDMPTTGGHNGNDPVKQHATEALKASRPTTAVLHRPIRPISKDMGWVEQEQAKRFQDGSMAGVGHTVH